MRESTERTRQRILEAAYVLFFRTGYTRTGVDLIAERAGVTKRTLYDHFASKDELLAAVLRFQHELSLRRFQNWSARLPRGVDAMLDHLFTELALWAAKPRWAGAGFTRLTFELADLPGHPARGVARQHKLVLEAWLADELAQRKQRDASVHAREIILLLEGSMALMLIHGDRSFAKTAAEAAKRLVSGKNVKKRNRRDA